ncbi:hypothetical protein AGABI1DRAFT_119942 [Agaricus bisporus var. burnettii JB137-S8]|uniref:Uncharacterized protein n=1 Tax=Agaricus bisporus var. burnettii (strain JB137-S8 / ATCC MYA-4627 / FGSC 10392) TaxID=597362 RepID=K5VZD6_AGABU|nr:uncharacterized protein AGABI1DRAFT_119942 [Agaricus bisporus var. burnettii JB137-S8]EKM79884.1 hypothetical protein AGABI1DRAFT_119942 [Agaricus bisporus var. burnettii JB137-S8]
MGTQAYSTFKAWFHERGGYLHDGVGFTYTVATEDIPTNATIITCPFSIAITEELAKRNLSNFFSADSLVDWTEKQWISTYICLHWILSDSKPTELEHYPYLDTLPPLNQLRTPLQFTKIEIETFKGSNLYHATLNRERQLKEEWQECQSVLISQNDSWGKGFTWERYLTAATYVSSRAFPSTILSPNPSLIATPETKFVLLPGVDAFNHKRAQAVSWSVTYPDKSGSLASSYKGPTISLVPHTKTSAGEEIFNNYGPKPNGNLILGYGFSLPANPDDTILLKIGGFEKKWEIGRAATGVEGLWTELLRMVKENQGADEEEYEIQMDTADMFANMLNDVLQKLPSEEACRHQDLRPEVATMLRDYIEGQRDILSSLLSFCGEKEDLAIELARSQGVELVIED